MKKLEDSTQMTYTVLAASTGVSKVKERVSKVPAAKLISVSVKISST